MNSVQLRCFLAAARNASFTLAAEELFLTQPALSRNVAALEDEVGVPLFTRERHHPLMLTAAGEAFLQRASAAAQLLDEGSAAARLAASGRSGRLLVGLLDGQFLGTELKAFADRLAKAYPNLAVEFCRDSYHGLLERLRACELDAAVTVDVDVRGLASVESLPLYELPTMLVVPASRARGKTSASIREFADLPFVCIAKRDSEHMRALLERTCAEAGFTPRVLEVGDLQELILEMELGHGIVGINPRHMVCCSPNLRALEVDEMRPMRFDLCIARSNKNPALSILRRTWRESADLFALAGSTG